MDLFKIARHSQYVKDFFGTSGAQGVTRAVIHCAGHLRRYGNGDRPV
jgi:hypothetical protein